MSKNVVFNIFIRLVQFGKSLNVNTIVQTIDIIEPYPLSKHMQNGKTKRDIL